MGISNRMFLIDSEDCLYRLPTSTFYAVLQAPVIRRYPQFAGQRVRMASICVELVDKQPTEIVRATFDILTFDDEGYFERCLSSTAIDSCGAGNGASDILSPKQRRRCGRGKPIHCARRPLDSLPILGARNRGCRVGSHALRPIVRLERRARLVRSRSH
jgi:hypothetical protein